MFAFLPFAFLALPLLSAADLTPTGPAPGQVFKQGAPCVATWSADTSGKWKSTFIELMTGNNVQMIHLTTVASNIDGTDPTQTSFTFPCPAVTPNSAIYFLQFTSPGQSPQWTGRFAISDPNGGTTPPPNSVQPNGASIPWGDGKLLSTQGTPPPSSAPPGQIDGSNGGFGSISGSSSTFSSGSTAAATVASNSSTATPSTTSALTLSTSSAPSDSPALNSMFSSAPVSTPSSNVTDSSSATTPAAAAASTSSTSSPNGAVATSLPAAPALVVATIIWLVTLC